MLDFRPHILPPTSVQPEVNAGTLESIVGPDGAEDLLIVTETNLLMINIAKLPADGDSDEVRQP